ncbi:MAG: hypothetical protein EPO46_09070 [Lysobacter sp.]|nr:MAG: hypothetical protein EPO46_09070 [Lysobacter sp.]
MSTETRAPLSLLDELLCSLLVAGLVLVALMPSLRGMSAIGWLPMWLVAMPAVAWCALRGFALAPGAPRARTTARTAWPQAPARVATQARRGVRAARRDALPRAA